MKKLNLLVVAFVAIAFSSLWVSCEKDEEAFALKSLLAGDIDINGATAASGVVANSPMVATFNKAIDAASLDVRIVQDYDQAPIDLAVAVNGAVVTITPTNQGTGALYLISFTGIKTTDGEALPDFSRSYSTGGSFVPAGLKAYWPFDGDPNDAVGSFDPAASGVVAITYGADRKGGNNGAAVFNGDNSIIEIPNGSQLINNKDFTLSFWMKTNSDGHVNADGNPTGHFVMGLGAFYGLQFEVFGGYDGAKFAISYGFENGKGGSEDMWMPANATDASTGGWQGWDYAKSLTPDEMMAILKDNWVQVVYAYNGSSRQGTLYYNGVKMKSFDFDLWPEGDDKRTVTGLKYRGAAPDVVDELAFGFIQSRAGTMWDAEPWGGYDFATANHFKGSLDEVRIFHKALTAQEVDLMYKSEKGN